MKQFLAEYWPWIVVPAVLLLGGILVLAFLSGGDSSSPFTYPIF